ncbi:MAG: TonB-dependent receptor, partial [Flavobacteriaceae bacterium]|nr:TonB-dependent receptor [Flavobacteriaceae bacterium]
MYKAQFIKVKHFRYIFLCCFFSFQTFLLAQEATISGVVSEASSNETLIGVTIAVPSLARGVITNEYGFYSLSLPLGTYELQMSYLGFETFSKQITLTENLRLDIQLKEIAAALEEVVLVESIERNSIRKPQMSVNGLTAASIKKIPVILGEADVLKSLLLLPGVTSAGEGASGFNVRGGAADQNLILLDEAIVFNSSHLFGFFS